jgi:phosphatidylglycerophosphate synthase
MSHNTYIHRAVRGLVKPLVNTPVSPNHITTVRLAGGIAAAILFATGNPDHLTYGAWLFLLSMILDRADGELARMSGKKSTFGHKYDLFSDAFCNAIAFVGIGIGLRNGDYGQWSIAMGTLAGLAVAYIFMLVTRMEALEGERAGEVQGFKGIDPDDGMLAVPLFILFGGEQVLLLLAAIGAPAFAIGITIMFRRAFRK